MNMSVNPKYFTLMFIIGMIGVFAQYKPSTYPKTISTNLIRATSAASVPVLLRLNLYVFFTMNRMLAGFICCGLPR